MSNVQKTKAEEYMLEIYRQKEEGDRRLLKLEKIVGFLFVTYFSIIKIKIK